MTVDWKGNERLKGIWIQTFKGEKFHPFDPDPDKVHIEDIAHSLANTARYRGHTMDYYSVAEHSALVAQHLLDSGCDKSICLAGLLHDAAEAYLVDMSSPIRKVFPMLQVYERDILRVVFNKFGLLAYIPEEVKEADRRIVANEYYRLFTKTFNWTEEGYPLPKDPIEGITIKALQPAGAEYRFMTVWQRLRG